MAWAHPHLSVHQKAHLDVIQRLVYRVQGPLDPLDEESIPHCLFVEGEEGLEGVVSHQHRHVDAAPCSTHVQHAGTAGTRTDAIIIITIIIIVITTLTIASPRDTQLNREHARFGHIDWTAVKAKKSVNINTPANRRRRQRAVTTHKKYVAFHPLVLFPLETFLDTTKQNTLRCDSDDSTLLRHKTKQNPIRDLLRTIIQSSYACAHTSTQIRTRTL